MNENITAEEASAIANQIVTLAPLIGQVNDNIRTYANQGFYELNFTAGELPDAVRDALVMHFEGYGFTVDTQYFGPTGGGYQFRFSWPNPVINLAPPQP